MNTNVNMDTAPPTLSSVQAPRITPLSIPWLTHDNFPTIKKTCSIKDGLVHTKKASVTRVIQELKRLRGSLDENLMQLEMQLLHADDFLSGKTNQFKLVPTQNTEQSTNEVSNKTVTDEEEQPTALNPMASLVEEDLASDLPSSTIGLWRYLSYFSYFTTVTLTDMENALELEEIEPDGAMLDDVDDDEMDTMQHPLEVNDDILPFQQNGKEDTSLKDVLQLRLMASLIPNEDDGATNDIKAAEAFDMHKQTNVPMERWDSSRIQDQIRSIGLIEPDVSDGQLLHCILIQSEDDEVSQEIRMLKREMLHHMRRNNDFKRVLRQNVERLQPWLSHDEEYQQIENKFLKLWRRKKDLQRKKKLKEKKQMRKEASLKTSLNLHTESQQSYPFKIENSDPSTIVSSSGDRWE